MDALDRYLNRVAYKFDKGYPDVNNPKDKEKLFDEWNMMLTDIFLNEYSDPKGYAKSYISDCMS